MNIVYGYGGMRSDGERLALNPVAPPAAWKGFSFRVWYRRSLIDVRVTRRGAELHVVKGRRLRFASTAACARSGGKRRTFRFPHRRGARA